ncbi:MAG: polyprenyl synthetase family protein [Firmicutes bacterium]|nr:polyprenyl synthetase family protein [Bacillota bacterium]
MAYALLGGGKRLRPLLVLGAAEAAGGGEPPPLAWRAAVAVECVHAYSLVHDDLPAMDNAAERRGRPSTHRAFGEAEAILVGDGLQALAFGVLAEDPASAPLVAELARAAGAQGMVGGQHLDLLLGPDAGLEEIHDLHRRKTGALFRASARLGGLAAGARPADLAALTAFGEAFGALYQAVDDLADAAEDDGRPSLLARLGRRETEAYARGRAQAALEAVAGYGAGAEALCALVADVLRQGSLSV